MWTNQPVSCLLYGVFVLSVVSDTAHHRVPLSSVNLPRWKKSWPTPTPCCLHIGFWGKFKSPGALRGVVQVHPKTQASTVLIPSRNKVVADVWPEKASRGGGKRRRPQQSQIRRCERKQTPAGKQNQIRPGFEQRKISCEGYSQVCICCGKLIRNVWGWPQWER